MLGQAFDQAKQLLQESVILNFPDPLAPLALSTDASKVAMGATLDQFVNGSWRPLGFWSKAFTRPQQSYSTFRRELMAVQYAMRHFNRLFNGRHLIVFTDHKPLIGSFGSSELQAHDPVALNAINEISILPQTSGTRKGKTSLFQTCFQGHLIVQLEKPTSWKI